MEPVKLGIIGCGIAARELHWPALSQLSDKFNITAACNRTISKAESYAAMVGGAPVFTDYHDLIASHDVEAVCIALPFHLNLEVTRMALEAGKHVIVEKPVASTIEESKSMRNLERRYPDTVTMVAENFRYRSLYDRVSEIIASGEIGLPYHVLWDYFFFVDPETNQYAGTAWRMDERYTGGFIVDAGVHNVALLRTLFGEFASGRGLIRGVTPALGKYDTFSFQFTMDSGVSGVMNLFYSSKGMRENTVRIFGDEGSILLERERLTVMKEGCENRVEDYSDDMGYRGEFENFYNAIRHGETLISTFEEGCRDFEVIEMAVQAAIENREIDFTVR